MTSPKFRKIFVPLAALFLFFQIVGVSVAAEKFPSRPINIIVPWNPGGMADVSGRIVGAKLSELLGVPVVIVNKPGATGALGTDFVKNASPDGYTLLAPSNSPLSQVPASNPNLPYKLADFAVIGRFVSDPTLIVAKKNASWSDFETFVVDGKKNPGKFNSGDGGLGGAGYLAVELIKDAYGLNIVPVHFKGSGDLKAAILGGVVDIASGNLSVLSSLVTSGEVTGLVVMNTRRSDVVPNVPSIKEKGFPDASLVVSNGLFAPKGTPPEVIDTLSRALARAMEDSSVKAQIEKSGLVPEYYDGPTYQSMLDQELQTIKRVVNKTTGTK
jgi:tripartite-type tricarboxylate transporter receptor subunit TctC